MVDLILLRQKNKERYFLLKHNSVTALSDIISIHEGSIIKEKGDYIDYCSSYKDYRDYFKVSKEIILEKATTEEKKLFFELI